MADNTFVDKNAPKGGRQVKIYKDGAVANAQYYRRNNEKKSELSRKTQDEGWTTQEPVDETAVDFTPQQAQVLMPWLTKLAPVEGRKLIDEYVAGYIESGEDTFALARMRSSDSYEKVFPGITRDDGSLRMSEATYLQNKEASLIHFNEYGIGGYGAQVIDTLFPQLVQNNVNPDELASRLSVTSRQLDNLTPEQKRGVLSAYEEYYSSELGDVIQLDEAALIPLIIDPEINAEVLNRRLNIAKVGNQYQTVAGVEASRTSIESLVGAGLQVSEAQRTFQAAVDRALITARVARQQRRDSAPTSMEILEAQYLGNLETSQELAAIQAQNVSESAVQLGAAKSQEGAVTGLTEK